MRVGFVTDSISKNLTGVGRYSKNLFEHLIALGEECISIDWSCPQIAASDLQALTIVNHWPFAKTLLWHLFLLRNLSRRKNVMDLDIIFDPSQFLHPFGLLNIPLVYVVHDVSFINYPECHKRGRKTLFQFLFKDTLNKADKIVCCSGYTKRQLLMHFPTDEDKIVVIHEAADHRFGKLEASDQLLSVQKRYKLPDDFLLYVGTIEPRKNLNQILMAYARMGEEISLPLYIAGKVGWRSSSFFRLHTQLELKERVRFLGYVPENDLPALYNLSTALVCVSKDEGFGLPPLEAMQCGTPVVVSTAGSLPEVVADAGLFADPDDVYSIGQALIRICDDRSLREDLRRRGLERSRSFSWENSASQLLRVFEELIPCGSA